MTAPFVERQGDERAFRSWYRRWAAQLRLSADPDDPQHFYDYRAAFRAGAEPDESGHFPSRFKRPGHPNLIVAGQDTRTGRPVTTPFVERQPEEMDPMWVGWFADSLSRALQPRRPSLSSRLAEAARLGLAERGEFTPPDLPVPQPADVLRRPVTPLERDQPRALTALTDYELPTERIERELAQSILERVAGRERAGELAGRLLPGGRQLATFTERAATTALPFGPSARRVRETEVAGLEPTEPLSALAGEILGVTPYFLGAAGPARAVGRRVGTRLLREGAASRAARAAAVGLKVGTETAAGLGAPEAAESLGAGETPSVAVGRALKAGGTAGAEFGAVGAVVPLLGPGARLTGQVAKAMAREVGRGARAVGADVGRRLATERGGVGIVPRRPQLYSRPEEAVKGAPFERGTSDQWRAVLEKAPRGVTKADPQVAAIHEFLSGRATGTVTKDEVLAAAEGHQVQLGEVQLGTVAPATQTVREALTAASLNIPQAKVAAAMNRAVSEGRSALQVVEELTRGSDIRSFGDPRLAVLERAVDTELRRATVAPPRYQQYTEPGGENYREIVVTLPRATQQTGVVRGPAFASAHWPGVENPLLHIRLKDRTWRDQPVTFLEELQSDWHQAGRQRGYTRPPRPEELTVEPSPTRPGTWRVSYRGSGVDGIVAPNGREAALVAARQYPRQLEIRGDVPDAPYKRTDDWVGLGLKRALQEAVEDNHGAVAWTTGATQAKRYNLARHVNEIAWNPSDGRLMVETAQGTVRDLGAANADALVDYIGKDAANRLVNQPVNEVGFHVLRGQALVTEGEGRGMSIFYDRIMPQVARDLKKKLGLSAEPRLDPLLETEYNWPLTSIGEVEIAAGLQLQERSPVARQAGEVLANAANHMSRGRTNFPEAMRAWASDGRASAGFEQVQRQIARVFNLSAQRMHSAWVWPLTEADRLKLRQRGMPLYGGLPRPSELKKLGPAAAGAAVGAGVGAAVDEEQPVRGAVVGGLAGAAAGAGARRIRARFRERGVRPVQAPQERVQPSPGALVNGAKGQPFETVQLQKPLAEHTPEELDVLEAKVRQTAARYEQARASGEEIIGNLDAPKYDLQVLGDERARRAAGMDAAATVPELAGDPGQATIERKALELARQHLPPPAERAALAPIDPEELLNFERMAIKDPAGEELLRKRVQELAAQEAWEVTPPKGRVPWSQTRREAAALGIDPESLARQVKGKPLLDRRELTAVRDVVNDAYSRIPVYLKKLADPNLAPLERTRLEGAVAYLERTSDALLQTHIPAKSEVARALNSLRILARSSTDPLVWMEKAKGILGDTWAEGRWVGGRHLGWDDVRTEVLRLVNEGKRDELALFISKLRESSLTERALTLRKAGLLSGLKSHPKNAMSNTAMLGVRLGEQQLASTFDWLFATTTSMVGHLTGKSFRGVRTTVSPFRYGVLTAGLKGAQRGLREAHLILKGLPLDDALSKWDIYRRTNYRNPVLDKVVNTWLSTYSAADRPFRGFAFDVSLKSQAASQAINEIPRSVVGWQRLRVERMVQLYEQPTSELLLQAKAAAEVAVFQHRTLLGQLASRAKTLLGERLGAPGQVIGEQIAPFTRTPSAVATEVAIRSPIGLIAPLRVKPGTALPYRNVLSGTVELYRAAAQGKTLPEVQRAVAERAAELLSGLASAPLLVATEVAPMLVVASPLPTVLGYVLADNGLMTGSWPTDVQEANRWRLEGRQANSVLINGKWRSVEGLSPFGNLMVLGANYATRLQDPDVGPLELLATAQSSVAKSVTDQSYVRGFAEAFDAWMNDPLRSATRFAAGQVTSWIPTIVRQAASIGNEYDRDARSLSEQVLRTIPGQPGRLPPRRDIFGEAVRRDPGFVANMVDPFYARADLVREDPLRAELALVRASIPSLRREKLEPSEGFELRQIREGAAVRQALWNAIGDPDYQAYRQQLLAAPTDFIAQQLRSLMAAKLEAAAAQARAAAR